MIEAGVGTRKGWLHMIFLFYETLFFTRIRLV